MRRRVPFNMGKTLWIIGILGLYFGTRTITGLVRQHALREGVIDVPNYRSSHSVATPLGGGLAFVIVYNLFVLTYHVAANVSLHTVIGFCGAGILIAAVGWLDDRQGLSAWFRVIIHCIAAAWAVFWIDGLPEISMGFCVLRLGFVGSVLAVVGIVWLINIYNFMDGIDGLAGSEGVTVAVFGGLLSLYAGNFLLARLSFALALSIGGFLAWNWPPAKVFMGDTGSGFLGFTFAYIALVSEKTGGIPLFLWLMLLAVFIVDATLTVIRRALSGEKWYEAHRSHVYQLAVQKGHSHKQVTLRVILINVCLALITLIAARFQRLLFPLFIALYGLLMILHAYLYTKWAGESVSTLAPNDKQDVGSN